jgi:hypothetical protein
VALFLTLALGCSSEQRDPVGLEDDDHNPGAGGGGGGGGATDDAFVGNWENIRIVEIGDDVQTTTTVWHFEADGDCVEGFLIESLLDGVVEFSVEACSWENDSLLLELAVTFSDGGGTVVFEYEFPGLDGNTLVLNGQEFTRVP